MRKVQIKGHMAIAQQMAHHVPGVDVNSLAADIANEKWHHVAAAIARAVRPEFRAGDHAPMIDAKSSLTDQEIAEYARDLSNEHTFDDSIHRLMAIELQQLRSVRRGTRTYQLTDSDVEVLGWLYEDAPAIHRGDLVRRLVAKIVGAGSVDMPPDHDPIPFDDERKSYVNGIKLRGGELPLPGQTTPEQLAEHCARMIGSFWSWPGNQYSNAELVYRFALGALRRMRETASRGALELGEDERADLRIVREATSLERCRVPAGPKYDWERDRLASCVDTLDRLIGDRT